MTSHRTMFTFVFTATLAAMFLIITGLIGYQPPAHLSLDATTWRRGTWADEVIPSQIALGSIFFVLAGLVAVRLNRRMKAKQS